MRSVHRREFLASGTLALAGTFAASRLTFASAAGEPRTRLVVVILRGAVDGLSVVPPHGDPDYVRLRRELAIGGPGSDGGALPLDATFGLHPSLAFLHESFMAQQLLVVHAVASPYRERSHFDGQDVLESGGVSPHGLQSGWLNRALAALPAPSSRGSRAAPAELGVALGQNVPLVMRGPAPVTSWSPSRLAALDDDTLQRITDLYANDPLLAIRLADALAADDIALSAQNVNAGAPGVAGMAVMDDGRAETNSPMAAASVSAQGRPAQYTEVVRAAAGFLRREDGPQVAVFDTTGWDTHANEGAAAGQLANRLRVLDQGLRTLRDKLGPVWDRTAVVLATEFGRTAATNGTRGTDHGTASAALVLGGAVNGGRVLADWPGLSPRALYQDRDLRPTLDLRSLLKGILADQLRISRRALETKVFADSAAAPQVRDLIRS
jgi:uncharacterized protein (DUF1501 family)